MSKVISRWTWGGAAAVAGDSESASVGGDGAGAASADYREGSASGVQDDPGGKPAKATRVGVCSTWRSAGPAEVVETEVLSVGEQRKVTAGVGVPAIRAHSAPRLSVASASAAIT